MSDTIDNGADSIESLPKLKECFIITPIGELNSEIYNKANGLINSVIKPVLLEFGFDAVAAHHINASGSINNQIIKKILESELVIANLTGLNPNVMYELAIRHSARLPVVIMAEKGVTPRLPFDITDQRTIFYDDTLSGSEAAKPTLKKFIEVALQDKSPDNPIYTAASQENIFKQLDEGDPLKIIMDKIETLGSRISNLSPVSFNEREYIGRKDPSHKIVVETNLQLLDEVGIDYKTTPNGILNNLAAQISEIMAPYTDLDFISISSKNKDGKAKLRIAYQDVDSHMRFYLDLKRLPSVRVL